MRIAIRVSLVSSLVAAATALSLAGGAADEGAFDSAEVKALAAKAEALKLDDNIALLKRLQRAMDKRLLTPADAEWKGFDDLKARGDAGLARILERGRCNGLVSPREGGAYWSFTKRSNSYDDEPELQLEQELFSTGFAGSDTGWVTKLPKSKFSAVVEGSVPDDMRAEANDVYEKARGSRHESPKIETGAVYAVRAVIWDHCDVLAAFQVVSQDNYGATIAWKILKTYETPKQKR